MQTFLVTLSAICALIAPLTYAVSIVRGKTKPHRITRFVLVFALGLNFIGIVAADGNMGAVVYAGLGAAQAIVIFLMSLKWGVGGSTRFDWLCFAVAMTALVAWKLTGNPVVAVWLSVLTNLVAYLPALVKTWLRPDTESVWVYIISIFAALLGLAAYPITAISVFQIYIIVLCITMLGCIYRKKIWHRIFRTRTEPITLE
jgi:hypothetical protein